jgi:crotonobetainyl-CoA:carnitine CoA-transferase CaiB-like acyl-CoA transferase
MALLRNAGQIGIAPELGAHNDDIFAGLGYTPAEIEDFRARKTI